MTNDVSLPRPRAVLFDWDNTLVKTWGVIRDALNTTFRAYGLPEWSMEETRAKVRHSMRDSFPAIFGDEWEAAGEVFHARYREIHTAALETAAGAEELLNTLKDRGVYMGVVSNKRGGNLRIEANHLGWTPYFGAVVGASDAAADKPDRAHVDMALAPSGGIAPAEDVWFVGDADIDMTCAGRNGMTGVLIRDGAIGPDEFPEHPPKVSFRSCEALCKFVRNM